MKNDSKLNRKITITSFQFLHSHCARNQTKYCASFTETSSGIPPQKAKK